MIRLLFDNQYDEMVYNFIWKRIELSDESVFRVIRLRWWFSSSPVWHIFIFKSTNSAHKSLISSIQISCVGEDIHWVYSFPSNWTTRLYKLLISRIRKLYVLQCRYQSVMNYTKWNEFSDKFLIAIIHVPSHRRWYLCLALWRFRTHSILELDLCQQCSAEWSLLTICSSPIEHLGTKIIVKQHPSMNVSSILKSLFEMVK